MPEDEDSQRRNAPVPEQLSLPWQPVPADQLLPELPVTPRTLLEAQASLLEELSDGTSCECCGKHAQLYKRHLNSTMVRGLIWLVRHSGAEREWIEVPKIAPAWLLRSNQLATLRLWDLVEPKAKDPDDTSKRSSGIWRPTIHGMNFAFGRITVPKAVFEYCSLVEGYSEKMVHVRRALAKEFDYYELMGWQPEPPPPDPPPEPEPDPHSERNPPPGALSYD